MAKKGLVARVLTALIDRWFGFRGWTVEGTAIEPRKFVIIAAPHTSNWDFVYFIGAARHLNLDLSFMGKASLFRWPIGRMMREMGGIPVDRGKSGNYVEAMIAEFARRKEFMLTIAPEGTRGKVRQWRTGFYHIAMGAGVPLICGLMDYKRKIVCLGPAIWPTGDYARDMVEVAAYYSACTPKHPERSSPGGMAGSSGP